MFILSIRFSPKWNQFCNIILNIEIHTRILLMKTYSLFIRCTWLQFTIWYNYKHENAIFSSTQVSKRTYKLKNQNISKFNIVDHWLMFKVTLLNKYNSFLSFTKLKFDKSLATTGRPRRTDKSKSLSGCFNAGAICKGIVSVFKQTNKQLILACAHFGWVR